MSAGPFSRKRTVLLFALGALSLLSWLLLIVFGEALEETSTHAPSAYGRGALGHRALVALLQRLDIPVVVSRHASDAKARRGVLVVAEPSLPFVETAQRNPPRLLLVLPKWSGTASPGNPEWISSAAPVDVEAASRVLRDFGLAGAVRRDGAATAGPLGIEPTLSAPQFVELPGAEVLLGSKNAALFVRAKARGRTVYVLSDPDLFANHGLGRGRNAELAVRILDEARQGGAVVFDETTHGFALRPSLWSELFRPPLLFALAQTLLAAAFLLLSGTRRFGAPAPAPPPISPGKAFLIGNTADLLRFGGHALETLERYHANAVQESARRLSCPPEFETKQMAAFVLERARERGLEGMAAAVEQDLDRARKRGRRRPHLVLRAARGVHRFQQELIHGSVRDS